MQDIEGDSCVFFKLHADFSLSDIKQSIRAPLMFSTQVSSKTTQNLQSEHQWNFNPRSAEDSLMYMSEKWRKTLDTEQVVGVPSASHPILL